MSLITCPECGKPMTPPTIGSLSDEVCEECERRHKEIADRKREQKLREELAELEKRR